MSAPIAAGRGGPVTELERIEDRVAELADLLKLLADAAEGASLQQATLNVAARHLFDTAEQLCTVLDQHR